MYISLTMHDKPEYSYNKNRKTFVFIGAVALQSAFFGQGSGSIWLDDVSCLGQESSLLSCSSNEIGVENCGHGEDASVRCSGTIMSVFKI